ncbi:MAG: hypothetical protein DRQ44_03200 [Gammaproteobacteria bacterium]|nr:MAG: hypothetical protein DRQ44_03200 [Gammaproteobacteria bacterium]
MKKISIGNHLTPYLLLACTLSAGTLALQSHNMIQAHTKTAPVLQPAVNQVTRKNFTVPEIAAFSEIVERPLFIAGREPPPKPITAPSKPARLPPLRLNLEGVVITPAASIAVLYDLSSNKMLHLTTGMKHQGWELIAVSDSVATFRRDSQSQELRLKK